MSDPGARNGYFSKARMCWGQYVGKLDFISTAQPKGGLVEVAAAAKGDFNAFREALIAYFAERSADFEVRVQLATNINETPNEDASVRWSEDGNLHRLVGRIVLQVQMAWSDNRSNAFDGRLSFGPANSLATHRPLGPVMRARRYEQLASWRRHLNGSDTLELTSLPSIPD